jgi:hypothetical protein
MADLATRKPSLDRTLDPIERFGKVLRRLATHDRLFDTLADLQQ